MFLLLYFQSLRERRRLWRAEPLTHIWQKLARLEHDLYSTYIGGNNEEIGYGVAVDASANAYVTGLPTQPIFL